MEQSYLKTRSKLETYFDRTAAQTWERLTSDAPVSRIRQTVREGRDAMRANLLSLLPEDLRGARVLDAGCGAGQMCEALALKGADVLGIDISPSLLEVAEKRMPNALKPQVTFRTGDMLDPRLGRFDFVVAMDSLIHYQPRDIAEALGQLGARTDVSIAFTIAPKTPMLTAMHLAGKMFPKSDRSPAIVPIAPKRLERELKEIRDSSLFTRERVNTGFYKSQAMELFP